MARILCLDTSVLIPYLVPEELQFQAEVLVLAAVEDGVRLVVPAFDKTLLNQLGQNRPDYVNELRV